MNRVWMHHFGRGIVATPSNFGQLGERPTHPELLDYLASEFVENGWSIKKLHRADHAVGYVCAERAGDGAEQDQGCARTLCSGGRTGRRLDVESCAIRCCSSRATWTRTPAEAKAEHLTKTNRSARSTDSSAAASWTGCWRCSTSRPVAPAKRGCAPMSRCSGCS